MRYIHRKFRKAQSGKTPSFYKEITYLVDGERIEQREVWKKENDFTTLFVPGIGGILLWYNVAVKLRLAKYEYLSRHPNAKKRG